MKSSRLLKGLLTISSGMVLLQVGGCTTTDFLEFLQTIFLGVTAAGAYLIFQNV